jgi:ribonuclease HII
VEQNIETIMGIDEAGRGPVLGPMVVAGVVLDFKSELVLKGLGIKDSKLLSPKQRQNFFGHINEEAVWHKVIVVWPETIDDFVLRNALNHLECDLMSSIIDSYGLNIEVYIDSPQSPVTFKKMLESRLKTKVAINCSFKADAIYPAVSAAGYWQRSPGMLSFTELHKEYGDFGSGYPGDPKTKEFLSGLLYGLKDYPYFVRRSWKTISQKQGTLFKEFRS